MSERFEELGGRWSDLAERAQEPEDRASTREAHEHEQWMPGDGHRIRQVDASVPTWLCVVCGEVLEGAQLHPTDPEDACTGPTGVAL